MATGPMPAADLVRYRELIGQNGLRDDEKDQVIHIVANIMRAFVEIAFQQNPTLKRPIESNMISSQEESSCDSIQYIQTMQFDFTAATQAPSDSMNAEDVLNDQAREQDCRHLLPR